MFSHVLGTSLPFIVAFIFNIEKLNNVHFDSLKLTKRSLTFEDIEFGKSRRANVMLT